MKQSITAGLLKDAADFIKTLSDALFQGLDRLIEVGKFKVDKYDKVDDNGVKLYLVDAYGNDGCITIMCHSDNQSKCDISVDNRKGKVKSQKNVNVKQYQDVANELWSELFGVEGPIESSRNIRVTLQRVCGSSEDCIDMVSVNANYSAEAALADIYDIVSYDDFADAITETPVTYDITDDGQSFDIQPCSETCGPNIECAFLALFKACYNVYNSVQYVHWNAKGSGFDTLHRSYEDCKYNCLWQIDQIAEWCVEYCKFAPHPADAIDTDLGQCGKDGFDLDSGLHYMQSAVNNYIATLELYYCNFDKDIQSVLDNWIREWKRTGRYKMERTLLN